MRQSQPPSDGTNRPEHIIEVLEENLVVDKRRTVTGRVKVQVSTETVEEIVKESLRGEVVEVTRVPMDRTVAEIPDIRIEGDVTVFPVVEEFLFVEKRLRLTEEVHIRRRQTQETVEMPVELKRQRAAVERSNPEKR